MAAIQNLGVMLYKKARQLIPGGTQLLSKRPEMHLPDLWPAYFSRAKGVQVWDLNGNEYIDMGLHSIGACVLGAADPDVDTAVKRAIDAGSASTLNCPEEVELAELLVELHPWAEQVRFALGGGEAMAIAIRIARAATGKDAVAFCGYHGWHDWYLAANLSSDDALDDHLLPGLSSKGVPRGLKGTALPFRYNDLPGLEHIVKEYGNTLGAIVMEPIRNFYPEKGFLEGVRAIASRLDIPLIFDEVSSGFRIAVGGAHLVLGVEPDIAVFAKALGNGYPIAAIIGRADVMAAAQDSFISSTSWTERIGPTAALRMIRKFRDYRVHEHLMRIGNTMQDGWREGAVQAGVPIHVTGIAPLSHFSFEGQDKKLAQTFFTQEMLKRGYLAGPHFYATYAHTDAHVEAYLHEVTHVFALIRKAMDEGALGRSLCGPIVHSDFHRLA